jgi:hypothetical protein
VAQDPVLGVFRGEPLRPTWARETAVSASSDRRMTVGPVPSWATRRRASAPAANSRKVHASNSPASGVGCTSSRTWVITPNVPSEPRNHRTRSGPAAEPGARLVGAPSVVEPVEARRTRIGLVPADRAAVHEVVAELVGESLLRL